MSELNDNLSDNLSDMSDSDSDINIDEYLLNNNNLKKLYQIQHVKDNTYKFVYMGSHEKHPTVEILKFDYPNSNYTHFINSKFIFEDDIKDNNLFDLMSVDSIIEGHINSLIVGVSPLNENHNIYEIIKDGLEFEGFINIYLHKHQDNTMTILKKNLTYPGNDKLIYYLIAELKTEKIKEEYKF
jgi:hypothetical protein